MITFERVKSNNHLNLFFRIPVPDLRSTSDLEKCPWWRREIHQEFLQIDVHGLELKTSLSSSHHPSTSSYDIGFTDAKGLSNYSNYVFVVAINNGVQLLN